MNKPSTQVRAVEFAKGVILRSTDWQEVQSALFDHAEFGPWLEGQESNGVGVIRKAEDALGAKIPANYSN